MMKTVKIQDIDVCNFFSFLPFFQNDFIEHLVLNCSFLSSSQNLQDEMMDLMDVSNEIQETLGRSYNVPDDIDEEELMGGKLIYPRCLHSDAYIMQWKSE